MLLEDVFRTSHAYKVTRDLQRAWGRRTLGTKQQKKTDSAALSGSILLSRRNKVLYHRPSKEGGFVTLSYFNVGSMIRETAGKLHDGEAWVSSGDKKDGRADSRF